jgi:hypothetical protein
MNFIKKFRTRLYFIFFLKNKQRRRNVVISDKPPVIIYRISDSGYNKIKPDYINNENCLKNAVTHFPVENYEWVVIADNVSENTCQMIKKYIPEQQIIKVSVGHGAGTFRLAYKKALEYGDDRIVYFLENDYLHRKGAGKILKEGFELGVSEYVTLYDHPDKYDFKTKNGFGKTVVFISETVHWKITNSTTMTFAAQVKTLKRDWRFFDRWTRTTHPYDFYIFVDLYRKGRRLISPIPTYSTHGETKFLSPLVDWEKECFNF